MWQDAFSEQDRNLPDPAQSFGMFINPNVIVNVNMNCAGQDYASAIRKTYRRPQKLQVSSRAIHSLHDHALAVVGRSVGVLGLLDLVNEQLKGFGNMDIVSGTSLGPSAAELLSELLAVLWADLALLWSQVALVADDTDRYFLASLHEVRIGQ